MCTCWKQKLLAFNTRTGEHVAMCMTARVGMHTHMHTQKGTSNQLGSDCCHCKTENRVGGLTFLLNEPGATGEISAFTRAKLAEITVS